MGASGQASVERRGLAGGDRGVEQTLNAMADLIDAAPFDPSAVAFARMVAGSASHMTPLAQAWQLRAWLASAWRFVADPAEVELLRDVPAMLIEYTQSRVVTGDCDEAAIMAGGLGHIVGLGVELVAVSFDPVPPSRFEHVYAVLLTPDGAAVNMDITKPTGPVLPAVRSMTMPVV